MNIFKEVRRAYRLWKLDRFYYKQEAPLSLGGGHKESGPGSLPPNPIEDSVRDL